MDTLQKIVVNEDIQRIINELTICEGTNDELSPFTTYVELTRHLREIYQWYDIFNYNYDMIKSLYPDDSIIALNSHTISIISTGKNLVDSMELCILNSFSDGEEKMDTFRTNYSSKEYDDNFSYRFLSRLRNFTQHLHIPVSCYSSTPCFDLSQIYDTPHYSFNKKLQDEANQLMDEVAKKTGDNLTLSYRDTVCAYCCSIYKIFNAFMNLIEPIIYEKIDTYEKEIKEQPDIAIHKTHPEYNGCVFYICTEEDTDLHVFNINDDPIPSHTKYLNDSVSRFKKETKELREIRKRNIPI